MTSPFNHAAQLKDFAGVAPLFPLPNTVLYPHVLLPLHIFEPRYRRMAEDALRGDRFIAMALLKPRVDPASANAAVHRTVCLGRITADERLDDGRFHLILQGLARAEIIVEQPRPDLEYRMANLRLCQTSESTGSDVEDDLLRHEVLLRYRKAFPSIDVHHIFQQLMGSEVPLGMFCDVLANSLEIGPESNQRLLEAYDVNTRVKLLLEQLNDVISSGGSRAREKMFPPPFSPN